MAKGGITMKYRYLHAFTLIELLIVVAIIAILAAIAVPNFLEAQTRAKVSRSKADMRSLATAIETYRIDWNVYPIASQWVSSSPDRPTPDNFNNRMYGLTTPISYMTSLPADVFTQLENVFPFTAGTQPTFEYEDKLTAVNSEAPTGIVGYNIFSSVEAWNEYFGGNPGAPVNWILLSSGPDKRNDFQQTGTPIASPAIQTGYNNHYDATNGTISRGDIIRTNLEQID